ncbi:MAG: hypothetical protein HY223_02200 [Thaumarchaeota archaeon]|nr:hypothetical protein [Nitrososphaerota archaeon]
MKTRIITLSLVFMMLLLVISLSPFTPKSVSAHISKVFGNYTVEVGWANEPAFTGQMNSIQVTVKKDNVDNGTAIVDALTNMQISVKYGTVSKQLDFVPSDEVLGLYSSPLIPTRVGSYNVVMKGTVEGQNIDTEYALDDVGSSDTINFPQTSDTSSNMGQIGTIINQLTSDIEDAKSSANSAAQSVANVGKSFQEVKDTTDRLYMISMAGIGIGVAGIVIAVFAISRKGEKI